jgi:hypothetical protein
VFDGLSFSKKQRFVLPIEDAKTAETRRRVEGDRRTAESRT